MAVRGRRSEFLACSVAGNRLHADQCLSSLVVNGVLTEPERAQVALCRASALGHLSLTSSCQPGLLSQTVWLQLFFFVEKPFIELTLALFKCHRVHGSTPPLSEQLDSF